MTLIKYETFATVLGRCLCCEKNGKVCFLCFVDEKTPLETLLGRVQKMFPRTELVNKPVTYSEQIKEACCGKMTAPIPVLLVGSEFSLSVWNVLKTIPLGECMSYSQVAEKIGNPKAVRGVANACSANPVCIIVPCHRVIGSKGHLTGYRGGIDRKKALLISEGFIDFKE